MTVNLLTRSLLRWITLSATSRKEGKKEKIGFYPLYRLVTVAQLK